MAIPISNVTRRVVYAASGTGPYAFTFEILANTDIAVYKDDTLLTLTTDYTVTIASNGTGSITLVASPTGATQIAIVGNRTIQRTTDFVTGGDFFANTVNDEMDQQTIFAQQNAEGLQRALSAPQTDPTSINMTLPRAALRANKALGFDANGNPVIADTLGTNRGNWASGTLYYVRDIIKDTTNSNIWQCIVQHTSSGSQPIGTNTDVAKWNLLVDAAAAAESASDAADSATAAAASASAASTSASSASTSASAASTSASGASTSATNAASSASAASSSASTASTAATNAGNSATTAATSATNASNSASAASTSASNASSSASSASTSASGASTSATNAASSATAAAGSASTASTQATNAASSATAAAGSATSAASAQTAAEAARDATLAAYDSFDDRYLGTKTSDPTVDNDGNALVAGALYFNSVDGAMKLYTGSAWVAAYVSGSGYLASANNLSDLASAATARTNLGLAIGTDVQAYDSDLTAWAGIATSAKQDTLVSGTNIKTINSTSLLGSGDISIVAAPAGSTGQVQYNNAGAFGAISSGTSGQVLTSGGAGAAPTWTTISSSPTLVRSARTSNTILGTADASTLIAITSGTFTQTFTAAATLGSGWFCYIQNLGTGDITLDPNGSETIDGLTSFIMYPGEARLVQCNGTSFFSVVLNSFSRTYTATDTFTTPPGYRRFNGLMWGGGGGGGSNATYSSGGGGGACNPFDLDAATFSATETFTVASGGAGGASNADGSVGGTSSIGTKAYAYGGGGGGGSSALQAGGGGILSAGSNNWGGAPSFNAIWSNSNSTFNISAAHPYGGATPENNSSGGNINGPQAFYGGGACQGFNNSVVKNSVWGGAGGGSNNGASRVAGTSVYGGNGGNGSNTTTGSAGTAPGGGGGAGNALGGAGARGEIRIWGVI